MIFAEGNNPQTMQEELARAFKEFLLSRGQTNILPNLENLDIQLKISAKVKPEADITNLPSQSIIVESNSSIVAVSSCVDVTLQGNQISNFATINDSLGENGSILTDQGKRSKDKSTDPELIEYFFDEVHTENFLQGLPQQGLRYLQNKRKVFRSPKSVPFNYTEISSIRNETALNLTKDGGSSSKKIRDKLNDKNPGELKRFRSKFETSKQNVGSKIPMNRSLLKSNNSWSENWLNGLQTSDLFDLGQDLPGRVINKTISRSFETTSKSIRYQLNFHESKHSARIHTDKLRMESGAGTSNPILQALSSMQDLEIPASLGSFGRNHGPDANTRCNYLGDLADKSRSACVASSNPNSARKFNNPEKMELSNLGGSDSKKIFPVGGASGATEVCNPKNNTEPQQEAGLESLLTFHAEMFKPDLITRPHIATDKEYKKKSRREPNYEQNLEELDKVGRDLADLYQSLELDDDAQRKKKTKISYLIQEREQDRYRFDGDGHTLIDLLENVKERDADESSNFLKKLAGLGTMEQIGQQVERVSEALVTLEQFQYLDHARNSEEAADIDERSNFKMLSYMMQMPDYKNQLDAPSIQQSNKIDLWIEDVMKKVGDDPEVMRKLELIKIAQEEECKKLKRENEEALRKAAESEKRAICYERQLKQVENFTNSYNSQSMSRDTHGNSSLGFKNMMDLLGDLYESEDVPNSMKMLQNYKESNLHFCFMFASPLVIFRATVSGNVLQTIPWEIEYNRDLHLIKKTLRHVDCDVKFLSAKASAATFVEVMRKNPMILHFCGHGVDNTRGAQQRRPTEEKIDNYYLLFEDHLGRGEPITYDHLEQMLSAAYKGRNNLEFVFVASCHSEIIAQVFLNAGASHVLCVAKDEKISDDICKTFAELYYQSFFCESLTFCEAFESAKRKIAAGKFFNGEEHKFMMLLRSDLYNHPHKCTRFLSKPSPESKFMDLTPVPLFYLPQFTQECFLGRNKEIYEVIDLLYNNRFVSIKGTIGIGKSSLAKEIINKLLDRGVFTHGIIYVDMKRDTSIERMFSVIINNQTLNKLVRKRSQNKEFDLQQAIDEVISILREYEVLLVFDNLDNLYVKSPGPIKSFFETIINSTTGVKIMITLFSKIESIQSNFVEIVYELGPLTDSHAAQLLTKRATRRVTENEIMNLYSDHACAWNLGRPTLEAHKLIKLFNGLPQAILMAASILHEKSLSEIYSLLKNSPVTPHSLNPLMAHAGSHDTVKVSVSLALEIVREMEELENLALVGFFPAGILEKDLPKIWGAYYQNTLQKLFGHSVLYKQQFHEDLNYYTVNG